MSFIYKKSDKKNDSNALDFGENKNDKKDFLEQKIGKNKDLKTQETKTEDKEKLSAPGDNKKISESEEKELQRNKNNTVTIADETTSIVRSADKKSNYESLGRKLIRKKLISEDQLEIALKIQRENKKNILIGKILVDIGIITEATLNQVLAEDKGINIFNPRENQIDPEVVTRIKKSTAEKIQSVPIMLEGETVYVAMVDIYDIIAIDTIRRLFPETDNIIPYQCSESDFSEVLTNYYDYDLTISGILKEIEQLNSDDLTKNVSEGNYVNPTVRLLDVLLFDAIRLGASDIHLEPEGLFVRIRYRVDGKLRLIRSFHIDYWNAVVVRVKIISDMNIAESRVPQDGRITYRAIARDVDFRVSTHPTIHGENIVLRILDRNKALLPLPHLGYSQKNLEILYKALKKPEGIIIVTGPTGSGKSTTLYSILSYINNLDKNIMTLEDPVEYQLPMIRQSNIKKGGGLNFSSGIKSSLRQDPDVIFIGEIRDEETASLALRAAMTGHQVFTTLHTNDALSAISRLLDIGVNGRILSETIVACIAQRLSRKLCSHCKVKKTANAEECKILNKDPSNPPEIYVKNGCEKCNYLGYKGRETISEIVFIDSKLSGMIQEGKGKNEMKKYIEENGFLGMPDDGVKKVLEGIFDIEELVRTVDVTDRM